MDRKITKCILAAMLMAALCLSAMIPQIAAYARGNVEVNRACSLNIKIGEEWKDLENAEISVKLYRVADISADGSYKPVNEFSNMDFSGVSSKTSAEDWTKLAETAASDLKQKMEPDAVLHISKGSGRVSGLETGLYLVYAEDTMTAEYSYTFSPYLISLPNNTYYTDGNDNWIYDDVQVSLKPEQTPRYGSLEIIKTLQSYDTTLGMPLFVFDVEAVKDGRTVYSNVLSLSFDHAGEEHLIVDQLPAGALVTVTEVYSGASYRLITEESKTVTIEADAVVQTSFINEYDDTLTYGSGVVNHFDYDGSGHWSWQQVTDNK